MFMLLWHKTPATQHDPLLAIMKEGFARWLWEVREEIEQQGQEISHVITSTHTLVCFTGTNKAPEYKPLSQHLPEHMFFAGVFGGYPLYVDRRYTGPLFQIVSEEVAV